MRGLRTSRITGWLDDRMLPFALFTGIFHHRPSAHNQGEVLLRLGISILVSYISSFLGRLSICLKT